MRHYGHEFNSFTGISFLDYEAKRLDSIKNEIEAQGKSYILSVDEPDYINYLVQKYSLEELSISEPDEIKEPSKSTKQLPNNWGESYSATVYTFEIKHRFTGSAELFSIRPSTWVMDSFPIVVDERASTVSFQLQLTKLDAVEFQQGKGNGYRRAFANVVNINKDAVRWNGRVSSEVKRIFSSIKGKYIKENSFFEAINVKVNPDTKHVFSAPTIVKKVVPDPPKAAAKKFAPEPTMAQEMYDDVLKVIYELGKSMEKKPSTYAGKDEEGLRDQFLLVLETRYEGATATGETFNRNGKTDIILKYAKDNSNLFIAECKVWKGAEEFQKAIHQLFDNYLTWRDSKVALMVFVRNKDFTNVLQSIQKNTVAHPYYLKAIGGKGESSFSYIFHLPQDKNKHVLLEIIAFHFDK